MKQPPRLAVWIVRRLAPAHEAIDGDLLEEFQRGRSSLWYWYQVIAAIIVGAIRAGRAHRFGMARGLAVGWIVKWTLSRYVAPSIVGLDESLFLRGFPWFMHNYGIAQIHGRLPFMLIACAVAIGGHLAVRASRMPGPSMAVIYAGTILFGDTVMLIRWLSTPPLANGVQLYSSYELSLVALVLFPTAALTGGLWGTRRIQSSGERLPHPDA